MKDIRASYEPTPERSIGGDQSLVLHMDNTTLHRLQYLIDPAVSLTNDPKLETLNVLHLLEALVLADEITVSSFESGPSQEISDTVLEALIPLSRADGAALVQTSIHSNWESQLEIARETAAEIYDRRFLTFNPSDDFKLLEGIDVAAARPGRVVEPTARFWEMIFRNQMTSDEIRARAAGEVHLHRTDGLFLFGVADHEEFRDQVVRSYSRFGPWSEDHWNRLHVLFRAFSNQRIADRIAGAVYSPPPIRAELLNRVNSLALRRFRETLAELAVAVSQRVAPGSLSDYVGGFKVPIPVLGLAALPSGPKSSKKLLDKLLIVRAQTSDLRNHLRRLNSLYMSGNADEAFKEIERECRSLKRGVAQRLGLTDTISLPAAAIDTAVQLSQAGMASVPDLTGAAKLIDWFSSIALRRRKRVRFLSNMLARAAEEPGLQAVRRYMLQHN